MSSGPTSSTEDTRPHVDDDTLQTPTPTHQHEQLADKLPFHSDDTTLSLWHPRTDQLETTSVPLFPAETRRRCPVSFGLQLDLFDHPETQGRTGRRGCGRETERESGQGEWRGRGGCDGCRSRRCRGEETQRTSFGRSRRRCQTSSRPTTCPTGN